MSSEDKKLRKILFCKKFFGQYKFEVSDKVGQQKPMDFNLRHLKGKAFSIEIGPNLKSANFKLSTHTQKLLYLENSDQQSATPATPNQTNIQFSSSLTKNERS